MFDKGTIVCMLLIVSVAIVLFLYVQQKTSRIEKNIKNVISFIKDVEQRVKENDNDNVKHVNMNIHDNQNDEVTFLSVNKNEIVTQQNQEDNNDDDYDDDDDDDSSDSDSEEDVDHEVDTETLAHDASLDNEVDVETLANEASLDNEVVNIKFKVDADPSDLKKLPVSELRELITSLDIQVEDVQKLKKKDAQAILEVYYAEQDNNNNNIDI